MNTWLNNSSQIAQLLKEQFERNMSYAKAKCNKKLRVCHYAQIPCKPFVVEVEDERQAHFVEKLLADQHCFLFDEHIIPDYSNVIVVSMYNEEEKEWNDYYNEKLDMDWNEFVEEFLSEK